MTDTVTANDGVALPLCNLPLAIVYDGDFVSTLTVQYRGNTYVQTFTNDGTNITEISAWINSAFYPPGDIMYEQDGTTEMQTEVASGSQTMYTEY
jgi:hypothetical protein